MTVIDTPAPAPFAPSTADAGGTDRRVLLIKGVLCLVGAVVLYELPMQLSRQQVTTLNRVMCIALAALGLNLLTGYNGQISIGHGAFMGIGAYTMAILVQSHNFSHVGSLVLAAVLTFVVGVAIGLPALRIRGVYLALVTLALATVFPQIVVKFSDVTGGTQGLQVENEFVAPAGSGLKDNQWRYYVILVIVVVAFVVVRNLVKSRVGRALIAMRDNETAAEVVGVNLSAYKVLTFGFSAMLAGIGGALLVVNSSHVDAKEFGPDLSITILVAVVVGGAATIFGPAIGAFLIVFLPTWFPDSFPKQLTPFFFGALLILLMAVAPGGIIGLAKQVWARFRSASSVAPSPSDVEPPFSDPPAQPLAADPSRPPTPAAEAGGTTPSSTS
jgi:branched-chain amino acid transport system permease protein